MIGQSSFPLFGLKTVVSGNVRQEKRRTPSARMENCERGEYLRSVRYKCYGPLGKREKKGGWDQPEFNRYWFMNTQGHKNSRNGAHIKNACIPLKFSNIIHY
jgi:hypothetical protein